MPNTRRKGVDRNRVIISYSKFIVIIHFSLFCRFATKDAAAQAIVDKHGTEINNHTVKCSWGKESSDPSGQPTSPGQSSSSNTSGNGSQAVSSLLCTCTSDTNVKRLITANN